MDHPIIPNPSYIIKKDGYFQIPKILKIKSDGIPLELISQVIRIDTDISDTPSIVLKISDKFEEEEYKLHISLDNIMIEASNNKGIYYGLQSLDQLINYYKNRIPCFEIIDKPRFKYRGLMIDVARHFQEIETIKKQIDMMSTIKMNYMHLHLTDDQGWRIAIKKYPKLTEVGSSREYTQIGGIKSYITRKVDKKTHSGFYTQEEIMDIVKYAKDRFIEIIPEIDMPGHSLAALASYPHLGCTMDNYEISCRFGIFKDIMCAGKETTYEFIEDVIDEIIELFPSEIIHIGGDETPKSRWKSCDNCNKIMNERKINATKLQNYFTDRVSKILSTRGKKLMGWNEIVHDELDTDNIVQHWLRGENKVKEFINKGGEVVISKFFYYYLDYNYKITPLRKTYNFEPTYSDIDKQNNKNIIGLEAALWSEWIPYLDKLEYQLYPRLIAVAERAWSIDKNYKFFKNRLDNFQQKYMENINYAVNVDPGFFRRLLFFI